MDKPNHEEALQLAYLRVNESNLARCYIDLFRKWEALQPNKHTDILSKYTGKAIGGESSQNSDIDPNPAVWNIWSTNDPYRWGTPRIQSSKTSDK